MNRGSNKKVCFLILCFGLYFLTVPSLVFGVQKCEDYLQAEYKFGDKVKEIVYPLEVPFGNTFYVENLRDYIVDVYVFAVSLAGVISVVAFMYYSFRYASSLGNQQYITNAKEGMVGAVVGLLILLMSFALLNFINPQLVNTDNFEVEKIPLPAVPEMECDAKDKIVTVGTVLGTKDNIHGPINISSGLCPNMKTLIEKAAYNLAVYNSKRTISRSISGGGYRDIESQWNLRQCYCHKEIEGECNNDCFGCKNCTACNTASALSCDAGYSMHVKGMAVDISFNDGFIKECGMLEKCNSNFAGYTNPDSEYWMSLTQAQRDELDKDEKALKDIMLGTGDGDYISTGLVGISKEFWHFEIQDKNTACASGMNCPCTGSAPTNCPSGQHSVCLINSTGTGGLGWKCEDLSTGSFSKVVSGMAGGQPYSTTYEYQCLVY